MIPEKLERFRRLEPRLELYRAREVELPSPVRCASCGREARSVWFLYFRWPGTRSTGRRVLHICKECAESSGELKLIWTKDVAKAMEKTGVRDFSFSALSLNLWLPSQENYI